MLFDDLVKDEFRKISLHRAVRTVFGVRSDITLNSIGNKKCFSPNHFVLKNGTEVETYTPGLFILDDSELLLYVDHDMDKEILILNRSVDGADIKLSYDAFNCLDISISMHDSIHFKESFINDFLYSPSHFFALTKLSNRDSRDKMKLCRTSFEIIERESKDGKDIRESINYKIENVISQELLNIFLKYCNLYEKSERSDLFKNLRRHGVYLPSEIDIDVRKAAKRYIPNGEFYNDFYVESFSIRFGARYYNKQEKSVVSKNRCAISHDSGYGEYIGLNIALDGTQDLQKIDTQIEFLKKRLKEIEVFSEDKVYQYLRDGVYEFNIDELNLTSQTQLEEVFSMITHLRYMLENNGLEQLLDKFLQQNIAEQDAFALLDTIHDDFSSVKSAEDTNQKNRVYYVTDKDMRRKVVKIMSVAEEAAIEHLILTEFGKHPVLSKYVPKLYSSELIKITVDGIKKYAIIEEDVHNQEQELFEKLLTKRNKKQVTHYLNYWMSTLAQLHHYGTEVLQNCLEPRAQKDALRLLKEKDRVRIAAAGIVYDSGLQQELSALDLENRSTLIHQDLRYENRIGKTAIDWGHAGRGNTMLDIVRVFVDPRFEGMRFNEDDYKQYIFSYLTEKKRVETNTEMRYSKKVSKERTEKAEKVSQQELQTAYFDFSALRVMYAESQAAYLITANGKSRKSTLMTDFLQYKLPSFERVFR